MPRDIKPLDFAIEKGIRLLENDNFQFYHFYVAQFAVKKSLLIEDFYFFKIIKNNTTIFEKHFFYNISFNKVIYQDSHEDPIIQTNLFYLVCLPIPLAILNQLNGEAEIQLLQKNKIIRSENIQNLNILLDTTNIFLSKVTNYQIVSQKDCIVTLHSSDIKGKYEEKTMQLKKDIYFDFKTYLKDKAYLGIQCSYENISPEIEEKHIVIGQKGMINSHMFFDGESYHYPLLNFKTMYQKLYYQNRLPNNFQEFFQIEEKDGIEIKNIKELIFYYQLNKVKNIFFMETSLDFIEKQYKSFKTYGHNNIFNNNHLNKKFHINLEVCKGCKLNHKCLQLVPSGLSFELFKKNIMLEDEKDCSIYKLIKKVESL